MAIDFPNSPTTGDTYTTNGKTYRWDGTVWGVYGTFTVDSTASDTEPTGVLDGHIWYRSDQSQTLIRYNDTWVEVGSAGGFDSSSTSFPSSLDSGTGFAAVEALQAKVGADSSAVTSSHDYKIADNASRIATLEARAGTNLVYNGAMQVAQRGTSVAGITSTGYYTADRWKSSINALGTWTQSVENDAPTGSGFRNSLKMLCTTADAAPASGDYCVLEQVLEGQDAQSFCKGTASAKQAMLSFWVKSNTTGTYIIELRDIDNGRQVSKSFTIDTSATWERKTILYPADTTGAFDNDNNGSLVVLIWLAGGSTFTSGTLNTVWGSDASENRAVGQTNLAAATNNYWQITGVQLEVGAAATDFQHLSFGDDLVRCQRYFEKSFNYGTAPAHNTGGGRFHNNCGSLGCGGNTYGRVEWQVAKRANPTMRFYDSQASHPATENWWRSFSGCSSGTAVSTGISWSAYQNFAVGYMQYATGEAFSFEWTAEAEL